MLRGGSTMSVSENHVESVQEIETSLWDSLVGIWQYQLFQVEGSSITLGKLILAIVLLSLGFFLSRMGSKTLRRRFISRLSEDPAIQYSMEKFSFYILYILVVLFVLNLLSIPLTVFTLVGGALAIGVGFGSQNVVSNFISGLIVMVGQPLRVGDWVEIEGVFGQVQSIGGRSTTLLLPDNKQTVVPNSFFLEKMFTNWTLNDSLVSGKLSLGVAYGTDPVKIRELLLQVANEHPEILKDPVPGVLFQDFAESSLNFDLIFWMRFGRGGTLRMVSSDLRFRLAQLLKENNISIPYPHREVLLSTAKPLSVAIQSGEKF
jgi:small-conductance mechanosensitive channel